MKINHSGFTLIEILIATMIAAILSGFVFGLVKQMSRATVAVDSSVDIFMRAALVQRIIEKDVSGVCVPFTALPQEEPKKQQQQKPATPPAPGAPKAQPAAQQENKEQKKAPEITKLFYAVGKGELIDLMTFITNNPLQTYGATIGDNPKPRLARVVYRLKQRNDTKAEHPVYVLMRQESYELDFEKFKEGGGIPEFEVIDNISSFECTFILLETEEDKNGKKKSELVESPDWDHEKAKGEKQEPDERRVPHAVTITVEIGDAPMKTMKTFEFTVPIVPDFMTKVPQVAPEQPAAAPVLPGQQKPGQPGAAKGGNPFAGTGLNVPGPLQPKSWGQGALPIMPKR